MTYVLLPPNKSGVDAAFRTFLSVVIKKHRAMADKETDLHLMLQGCHQGNRNSQRKLYEHFYGYAMSVCLRYSRHREEAVEILNDAFLKAFTHLDKYDPAHLFRPWLRRILINSAIDYYRRNQHIPIHIEMTAAHALISEEMPLPNISEEEDVLPILRELSPAYRLVFNLYVMEGYTHQEIAEMLGIDARTSRSNLLRAKENIRALLLRKKPFIRST